MRHQLIALLLLLAVSLPLISCKPNPHAEEMLAAWDAYSAAYDDADAETVVRHTTESSFSYYERMRRLALDGTREDLMKLSPSQFWEVAKARHRASRKELAKLDGKGYLTMAIRDRWYDMPPSYYPGKTGEVTANEHSGRVELTWGRKYSAEVYFEKHDGVWQVDAGRPDPRWEHIISEGAHNNGMAVHDFVLALEKQVSGRPIDPDRIWKPMR